MSHYANTHRSHAFALAKSLGYQGEEAAQFLRDTLHVKSLLTATITQWQALNALLRKKVEALDKPHLVTEPQWGVVCQLRRKLQLDDTHFKNLVKRITRLEHPQFLDVGSCRELITGLNKILAAQNKLYAKARQAKTRSQSNPIGSA